MRTAERVGDLLIELDRMHNAGRATVTRYGITKLLAPTADTAGGVLEMPDGPLRERLLADWGAMRGIVDEGLELARSTSVVEAEAVLDVDSMIASIVADEAEAGHVVSFDIGAGRDVTCRPQMLRRCVQNLVDNVIRYGGDAHLSTEVAGKTLCIAIRDSGAGIPEDRLDDVFKPMVRLETSRSRETGGSGLGLTIARILARRNRGTLTLANLPGRGFAASIRLPLG